MFRQATLFGDAEPTPDANVQRPAPPRPRCPLVGRPRPRLAARRPTPCSTSSGTSARLAPADGRRCGSGRLPEPRLTSWWTPDRRPRAAARCSPSCAGVLSARYGEAFDSIGFNCYRDGNDSVAWHGDRHRHTRRRTRSSPSSASAAARPFRLRPMPGGPAVGARLVSTSASGDLLVMGGACQHEWEHVVPEGRAAPSPASRSPSATTACTEQGTTQSGHSPSRYREGE